MLPDGLLKTFASTFREWHYFVGGGAIGFVAGWVGHAFFRAYAYARISR